MGERPREQSRQARLPTDRVKLIPGDYGGIILDPPDHVRAVERWQVKESAFKHPWQVARGPRDRWAAVYDVIVAWAVGEGPQNAHLKALAASLGAPPVVPLWASYLTRPGAQKSEPPARSSTLYKLLRKSRDAIRPGQIFQPEDIDFRMPLGLYIEFRVGSVKQDADRDPVNESDPLAYSVVRKVLRATTVTPQTPLEASLFSVLGSRYSVLATLHSTSEASTSEKPRSCEIAPAGVGAGTSPETDSEADSNRLTTVTSVQTLVGLAPAGLTCDVTQAVAVQTPGGGMTAGSSASPTRAAGPSGSAAPGASAVKAVPPTATELTALVGRFGAQWRQVTILMGPCTVCGTMMRGNFGTEPFCPRC